MNNNTRERADIDRQLHKLNNRLHRDYDTQVGPAMVEECLRSAAERVDHSRVPDFQPLLIERYAREALQRHGTNDEHDR